MKRFQIQALYSDGFITFDSAEDYEKAIGIMRDSKIEGDTMRIVDTHLNVTIAEEV